MSPMDTVPLHSTSRGADEPLGSTPLSQYSLHPSSQRGVDQPLRIHTPGQAFPTLRPLSIDSHRGIGSASPGTSPSHARASSSMTPSRRSATPYDRPLYPHMQRQQDSLPHLPSLTGIPLVPRRDSHRSSSVTPSCLPSTEALSRSIHPAHSTPSTPQRYPNTPPPRHQSRYHLSAIQPHVQRAHSYTTYPSSYAGDHTSSQQRVSPTPLSRGTFYMSSTPVYEPYPRPRMLAKASYPTSSYHYHHTSPPTLPPLFHPASTMEFPKELRKPVRRRRRPPVAYAVLIAEAILTSPNQRLTLREVYKWVVTNYPYLCHTQDKGWQNTIRHNLSLNKFFVKVPRAEIDGGSPEPSGSTPSSSTATALSRAKGCYWTVDKAQLDTPTKVGLQRLRGTHALAATQMASSSADLPESPTPTGGSSPRGEVSSPELGVTNKRDSPVSPSLDLLPSFLDLPLTQTNSSSRKLSLPPLTSKNLQDSTNTSQRCFTTPRVLFSQAYPTPTSPLRSKSVENVPTHSGPSQTLRRNRSLTATTLPTDDNHNRVPGFSLLVTSVTASESSTRNSSAHTVGGDDHSVPSTSSSDETSPSVLRIHNILN
ncbi:hypothetical protein IWQ62_002465 [Dispira parvispora]|uniref:Fork-head domain-containing protein n=1 Tax=Dispira parvispora TaxID=1520584 RepID=A0A9W8ASQ9_9FUNG|nr:hypothetical protein IWQ62_002465 [Dispira parvispora]